MHGAVRFTLCTHRFSPASLAPPQDVNSPLFRTFLAATGSSHGQGGKQRGAPKAPVQNPPKPLTE